jgi:hypothetical protein
MAPQVFNQAASFIAEGEETTASTPQCKWPVMGRVPLIIGCHNTHRLCALRECGGLPRMMLTTASTLLYHNRMARFCS